MKQLFFLAGIGLAVTAFSQVPPPQTPAPKTPGTLPSSPSALTTGLEVMDANKVVLTVGDEKFTVAEYDQLIGSLPLQYQKAARGPQKRQIAEQLAQLKILSKEAEKRSLDQQPIVKKQLSFSRDNVLANALYQELLQTAKVDDAAIKKYYDEHKTDYESLKARHILIRMKGSPVQLRPNMKELTDEEALAKAQDIRKQLAAGADFATLAKVESDDTGSGANGGDLGTFKHGQMVAQFDQAAFALPIGELSQPVKTQFGYHVIKVEGKQNRTLEEARQEIMEKLRPDLAKQQADDLRKKTAVTLDESFFGPATPNQ